MNVAYSSFCGVECTGPVNDTETCIESVFYSEMLQWWCEFCLTIPTESASYKSIIWNNCNIKINGTPIYYHSYVKAGVIFVSDLIFSLNNIESFNIAEWINRLKLPNLVWSSLFSSKTVKKFQC